jgi:hypothetical protein
MIYALKALFVKDGLICMVDRGYADWLLDIKSEDILVDVADDGLVVVLENQEKPENNIILPIPEELIDYVIDNRRITVYTFSEGYIERPVINIDLLRDTLIEARSIYLYKKSQRQLEGNRQPPKENLPSEKIS